MIASSAVPRPVSLPASALPSLQDWLGVRSDEPGPLFSAVLKNGSLVRDSQGTAAAAERLGRLGDLQRAQAQGGIQPPAPHDLRRTWTGVLLEAGVDLATVQKMAGHASCR